MSPDEPKPSDSGRTPEEQEEVERQMLALAEKVGTRVRSDSAANERLRIVAMLRERRDHWEGEVDRIFPQTIDNPKCTLGGAISYGIAQGCAAAYQNAIEMITANTKGEST